MEPYIPISKINDFVYCPLSLYLHRMYEQFDTDTYHQTPQVVGSINHECIETGMYSSAKRFITGLPVYNEKYRIMGKIDIYDDEECVLIERKTRIKKIHPGYIYQLWAQYFCMTEMGYYVDRLILHSLEDNKRCVVGLPEGENRIEFEDVLQKMRTFNIRHALDHSCAKCTRSIYGILSW